MSNSIKVLCVDDNEHDLRAMEREVSKQPDVALVSALSAAEALQIGTQLQFDLCLIDVHMPDLSGAKLIETMRKGNWNLAARVVFVSGVDRESPINQLITQEGGELWDKPIDSNLLNDVFDEIRQSVATA
ncbi:MAG: response regulator [Litorivicinus sp.]